jgi:hypothetical protein
MVRVSSSDFIERARAYLPFERSCGSCGCRRVGSCLAPPADRVCARSTISPPVPEHHRLGSRSPRSERSRTGSPRPHIVTSRPLARRLRPAARLGLGLALSVTAPRTPERLAAPLAPRASGETHDRASQPSFILCFTRQGPQLSCGRRATALTLSSIVPSGRPVTLGKSGSSGLAFDGGNALLVGRSAKAGPGALRDCRASRLLHLREPFSTGLTRLLVLGRVHGA